APAAAAPTSGPIARPPAARPGHPGPGRLRGRMRGGSSARRWGDGSGPRCRPTDRWARRARPARYRREKPRARSLYPLWDLPNLRKGSAVALVVQKYGGSSVSDAERIRRVAERIVETKKAGNDVVVVISAMGDSTDELLDMAKQVSPAPPARELDMLLTAGERISNALVAMAIESLGAEARSFTGSQAGVVTTGTHGNAKIIDVTP